MIKRLLVSIASKIIHKYGCFNLDLKSTIIVNGKVYVINSITVTRDFFKNDLSIEASDIIPFKQQ
jgi:hypothetical protein